MYYCPNIKGNYGKSRFPAFSFIYVHFIQNKASIWASVRENVLSDMRPTKTQISLCIRTLLSVFVVNMKTFASFANQYAFGDDSDQAARVHKLIWIFAGRTCPKELLLCTDFIVEKIKTLIDHMYFIYPKYWDRQTNRPVQTAWTITKTYLYNFDPLKPHCGLQGCTLFFLFLLKNIDCGR